MITWILVSLVVVLLGWFYKITSEKLQIWEKRGIKHIKPVMIFGNTLIPGRKKINFFEFVTDYCKENPNEPFLGVHILTQPFLVVQDLNYIEKILIKDFHHFTDRGTETNEEKNPLDAQIFFIRGDNRWRAIRYKLTPIFTLSKMKSMFAAMEECGNNFLAHLEKQKLTEMNLKETTNLLFIDIVGSAIFGIDVKAIENPDSKFRQMCRGVFDFGKRERFIGLLTMLLPGLAKRLGLSLNKPEVVEYFTGVLSEAFAKRASSKVPRNDFIQLIMQLKEKGAVEVHQWDSGDDYLLSGAGNKPTQTVELTDSLLMSQAYAFLTAGVDMLGLIATYAAFDLAQNPEKQEKTREEIHHQIKQHGGLTFDALKAMVYFDNVIKESIRLHPTPMVLMRECTKDYTFENGYTILKGEKLWIPLMAVHTNPDYFPQPDEFKPERFEGQMKPPAFLSFGDGPRMCIAMRFALLEMKYCMSLILNKYKIKLNPKTVLPLGLEEKATFLVPRNDIIFDLESL